MRILHVADRSLWAAALTGDSYQWSTRDRTLQQEGFLHASTAGQLPGVLARYYADVDPADHVLLVIDVEACAAAGSPVRWDPVTDTRFPHIYGPLPVTAVVAQLDLAGPAGVPELAGLDVVADPPV